MSRKTWIKLKRGILEAKHREQLGPAVWLYIYILDRADWEQGAVLEWKDKNAADEMQMELRTVREHRRRLEDEGYIKTSQKQYHQKLYITNWTNPREYSGKVYNQGDINMEPQEFEGDAQGDIQGYTQGVSKHVTPTYNSHITTHKSEEVTTIRDFLLAIEDYQGKKLMDSIIGIACAKLTLRQAAAIVAEWRTLGTGIGHLANMLKAGKVKSEFDHSAEKYLEGPYAKYINQ